MKKKGPYRSFTGCENYPACRYNASVRN
ncbi:MAG: topoisomerase DNA-binding C4 zinc finger domain-containing protein [Bacteroidales bacterium]|nr:topoisomerase DNA-binding C4 zinc finger domain-containing protein [Bacteroidales bacterium]